MIDINKLLEAKRLEITFADAHVDRLFVKSFRERNSLTQVALANILGVSKKTIEKWEQGTNKVGGSSAVLLKLLSDNPELIGQLYSVRHDIGGRQDEFTPFDSVVVNTSACKYMPLKHLFAAVI